MGHCFHFISATGDLLGRHEQFKGYHRIMNNAPIYKLDQIAKLIINWEFGCVYFHRTLQSFNLIEQFWFIVKSKMKVLGGKRRKH